MTAGLGPTKQFLESKIKAARLEQERLRDLFNRQQGSIDTLQFMIDNGVFVEEGAKEKPDGVQSEEAAGGKE